MSSIAMVIRVIFNIILFIIYFLITHVLVGILAGAFIKFVLGYPVPMDGAMIWDVLAIISLLWVFVVTLTLRKYLYLCLDKQQNKCD